MGRKHDLALTSCACLDAEPYAWLLLRFADIHFVLVGVDFVGSPPAAEDRPQDCGDDFISKIDGAEYPRPSRATVAGPKHTASKPHALVSSSRLDDHVSGRKRSYRHYRDRCG